MIKLLVMFLIHVIIFYHNGLYPLPLPKTQVLLKVKVKEMEEHYRCVKGKDKEDVDLVRMYKELDLMDKEKAMNILDKEMDMIKVVTSLTSYQQNPISFCLHHRAYNSSYIGPLSALQVLSGSRYRPFCGNTLVA